MHQKVYVLIVFIYAKKGSFEKKKIKFDHSLVFSCLHLLFPKIISLKIILTTFLCYWFLPFSTKAPLSPLPPQNLLDHVNG